MNKMGMLIVDLSTSEKTGGARIVPLVKYFGQGRAGFKVSLLINEAAKKTYWSLLGKRKGSVGVVTFPFSRHFGGSKFSVGCGYFRRMLISPFIRLEKDIKIVYSLTGIICDVFAGFVFKRRRGIIWVANVDNIEKPPGRKPGSFLVNLLAFWLFRGSLFFLRYADAIFVTTPLEEVRKILIKGGVDREKIFLSDNGVFFDEIEKVNGGRKSYGAAFLGRLHCGKGIFDLVEIWKRVVDRFPQAGRLVMIGSGDKETTVKLKEAIRKEGLLKKIVLSGFVNKSRKYCLLKKSKVFLYPSYYDANPISTVEALACGLPVIAYDLPIFKEHYPQEIIKVVPRGDKEIFFQKVVTFLSDQSGRSRLIAAGVKWARGFNWEKILGEQREIILKVLEERGKC